MHTVLLLALGAFGYYAIALAIRLYRDNRGLSVSSTGLSNERAISIIAKLSYHKKAYDIMTALRGPDTDIGRFPNYDVKMATTAVLRHAIDPHFCYGDRHPDNESLAKIRRALNDATDNYHFIRHAQDAFEALGLDWLYCNTDLPPEPWVEKEYFSPSAPSAEPEQRP